ncbi:hypothetical protein PF005_g11044 [Phytophthora fragariae]|nr:hypothetical protein PF009_g12392 [Phytophthora fragariae]KAE9111990.1 hypothetical protein PF007_g11273 [Phytophthora fragariae]KAE9112468.1 hypothetical protein PF010_g10438 [Phytophthora fragariae]KAE9144793.1 hypothetical protein PF006_g10303 [Phytophthora fragariae]KAE9211346.1 hypothetical protein PF005_g11044 [Phytophthora fragariae]
MAGVRRFVLLHARTKVVLARALLVWRTASAEFYEASSDGGASFFRIAVLLEFQSQLGEPTTASYPSMVAFPVHACL